MSKEVSKADNLNEKEVVGFFWELEKDVKKQFNLKCISNNTTMSEQLRKMVDNYIKE